MKTLVWIFLVALFPCITLMSQDSKTLREERDQLNKRGLHRELVTFYEGNLLPVSDTESGKDLRMAINALQALNAWKEFDGLVERAVATHLENPHLLETAAADYQRAPHWGRLIAGEFERDSHGGRHRGRGGPDVDPVASAGSTVETTYRDHVRSLQLLLQALPHAMDEPHRYAIWNEIGQTLRRRDAWQFQTLTPLETLPEWGEPGPDGGTEGAPWAKDGPVLFEVPASWEAAKTDGERWRFSLAERTRLMPNLAAYQTQELARFSHSQFGTETLSSYGWWRQQDPDDAKGILEMDTLAEDECLARTSDGVRRFKLPPEHHFIALYRSILEEIESAGDELPEIFLNRRQYDKAREVLEQTIAKHGPGNDDHRKKLLQQIVGNWGRFEIAATVPAGSKPVVPLVFRNATRIQLTAAPVDMERVLADTTAYLKSNPRELDWQRLNPSTIAQRLITGNGAKYIGKPAATWESQLTPRPRHRDTRTDLEIPLSNAGAWWISGSVDGGNSFHTLVWIVDSVLVQNTVAGQLQWWVADASTGAPVADSQIDFFGYRTIHLDRKLPLARRMEVHTRELKRSTDADGRTLLKPGEWDQQYQWLAIARKPDRATAFFGFRPFSVDSPQYENGNRDITYGISDRPLYKPGDTARLKFYLRNVGYSEPEESRWANQSGRLVVMNGRGEEALKIENLFTDALGAVETEFIIPKDAVLGVWSAF